MIDIKQYNRPLIVLNTTTFALALKLAEELLFAVNAFMSLQIDWPKNSQRKARPSISPDTVHYYHDVSDLGLSDSIDLSFFRSRILCSLVHKIYWLLPPYPKPDRYNPPISILSTLSVRGPILAVRIWRIKSIPALKYRSVTEAPHNIDSLLVMGEETFCFFETPTLKE